MDQKTKESRKHWVIPLIIIAWLLVGFILYTHLNSSQVATPPAKPVQCYLVLPSDEVHQLFLDNLFAITPDEYANLAIDIWHSSSVKDVGNGDWLIYASYHATIGTWQLTQEPPEEFTFLRLDAGAQYIEDSVLSPLWERPNVSTMDGPFGITRQTHYAIAMRPMYVYRAVSKAVTAKANGDLRADYLQGLADGMSKGITLKYEAQVIK